MSDWDAGGVAGADGFCEGAAPCGGTFTVVLVTFGPGGDGASLGLGATGLG